MNNIRCLLVDDEPPAIDLLKKYTGMIEQLEVVGTSHSAVRAFDMLKDGGIDLMFLDIRMPVLNGIDFIKTLRNPPAIILTTAYREYALEGYDLDIVDYLLKPIAFDRFLKAVDRYRGRTFSQNQNVKKEIVDTGKPEYIFININRTRHKVVLNDILFIESLKDYVRIHTRKEKLVVKGNMGQFMKQLPDEQFVRIHRSYAVATACVKSYNQSEVAVEEHKLPLGQRWRDDFLKRFL